MENGKLQNIGKLLDELAHYFATTSKKQIKKDFKRHETKKNNVGPSVVDYLEFIEKLNQNSQNQS